MSDFEKYIEAKYPNRSPKILFQKFKDIDGTLFYGVKEIEDQAGVWQHQQAKIDRLNSVLDERTKEWLQAIECGTYFENVAKPLKAENDELQKRINDALFKMRQQSLVLREDMDGYKDPVQLCQSEGFDMCVKILEKALRGEHE